MMFFLRFIYTYILHKFKQFKNIKNCKKFLNMFKIDY